MKTIELQATDTRTARLRRLRVLNLIVGALHLLQAVLMFVLSTDLAFPVVATFLTDDPVTVTESAAQEVVFELPIGPTVALFLLLAAVDHLLMATPGVTGWYESNLRRGRNLARWTEYAFSASIMLVLIAMLAGIWNLAALVGLFAATSAMILFGWLQETDHEPGGDLTPFWFGTVIGLVPWAVIGYHLVSGADPPTFVYIIFGSLFVLFSSFGVNQWLQYRRIGPWRDYLYGEQAYIVLSLVAKSLLAWQIFANVLRS